MSSSVSSAPPSHRLRKSCSGTMFNVFSSTVFEQCESCQLPQAMRRRFSSLLSSITFQLLVHRLNACIRILNLHGKGLESRFCSSNVDCHCPGRSVLSGSSFTAVEGAHHRFSSSCYSNAHFSLRNNILSH